MISIELLTSTELMQKIADRAKQMRLKLNLSQQSLSSQSGVSFGVIKKFERTGKISLESLLKLAIVLGATADFKHLFAPLKVEEALSLDAIMRDAMSTRKRGRK